MAICGNCFNNISESGACPICGYDNTLNARKYASTLPVGTVLNRRFFVGRVLGEGGFGITYLAQDYATKERVAIKEYFPKEFITRVGNSASVRLHSVNNTENFETGKQQFLAEARTLAEFIGDEHIVRIYRYFEENDTADRVFLLSIPEAGEYFPSDKDRACLPTAYAMAQGVFLYDENTGNCVWWLRSPGAIAQNAAFVRNSGAIASEGTVADSDTFAVRPAMWVDLSRLP